LTIADEIASFFPMASESDEAKFLAALRRNPRLAAPALPKAPLTAAKVRRYKERLRAYDAARLELKVATPAEIQRQNSVSQTTHRPRILELDPEG
jgi:hypothetical protein